MISNIERIAYYFYEIEESICKVNEFLTGKTKDDFKNNEMLQDAINMRLLVIGEAVNNIGKNSKEILDRNKEIPWNLIRGMRNKIAHEYFCLDANHIWEAAKNDLPKLKETIEQIKICEPELSEIMTEIKKAKMPPKKRLRMR